MRQSPLNTLKLPLGIFFLVLTLFCGAALVFGWAVSSLWNVFAVPQGANPMSTLQGTAVYILSQVFFSGIRYTRKVN